MARPLKNLAEIENILSGHRAELEQKYHVRNLGVFGSYARAEHKKGSDIDILVEFNRPIGMFKFLELEEYLGSLLGLKVDLVTTGALKPHIALES